MKWYRAAKFIKMSSPAKKSTKNTAENVEEFISNLKKSREQTAKSVLDFKFNKKRVRIISQEQMVPEHCENVVYWMSRDSRVQDNWAFLFAQKLALKNKVPLHVCFCLISKYLDASVRQFDFLLKGLQEVSAECERLNIGFHLLEGSGAEALPDWVRKHHVGAVVCDFNPLRVPLGWVNDLRPRLPKDVPLIQVDAHNIVPCWVASDKQEYSARTIRNKINSRLDEFLTEFPPLIKHPHPPTFRPEPIDWEKALESREADATVGPVDWARGGSPSGLKVLHSFVTKRLKIYADKRNDPNLDALSNLSPWLHFGQVAAQRAALCAREAVSPAVSATYLEELIVRRELSDNFCFYNDKYDQLAGASNWAITTLNDHRKDKRNYIYTLEQLVAARTHDELWNAAQMQLARDGKMHGFLRMYWAKKILEWSETPELALKHAIYLNDHFSIDGRDPSGYVGCMWSICGIHDQGWAERAVFGKIRYMNYQGCQRKFDVAAFAAKYGARSYGGGRGDVLAMMKKKIIEDTQPADEKKKKVENRKPVEEAESSDGKKAGQKKKGDSGAPVPEKKKKIDAKAAEKKSRK